jgi:tRNA(Ile)-lysidine synthase
MPRERTFESGTRLVRPLLDTRRSQVLDYLAVIGQDFRTDESNADETYTRNRLRQKLIPQLAAEYNPQVAEALRRLGQQAGEAQAAVEFAAGELLDGALDEELPRECRLKWQPLVAVPPHLVRELLTQLWRRQNWPRQSMTFEHWDALAMIVRTGGAATFPGPIDARREGKWVILKRTPG